MIKVLLFLEISHYNVTQFFLAMGIGPLKDRVQILLPQFEFDCLGHRTQVRTQWGHGFWTLGCQK